MINIGFARTWLPIIVTITLLMGLAQVYLLARNNGPTHCHGWVNIAASWTLNLAGIVAICTKWTRYNGRGPILIYSIIALLAVCTMAVCDTIRGETPAILAVLLPGTLLPISVISTPELKHIARTTVTSVLLFFCQFPILM